MTTIRQNLRGEKFILTRTALTLHAVPATLELRTSKHGKEVKATATVSWPHADGQTSVHRFSLSTFANGDYYKTVARETTRATDAALLRVHTTAESLADATLADVLAFYAKPESVHRELT